MNWFSGLASVVAVLIGLTAFGSGSRAELAQDATSEAVGAILPPEAAVDGLGLGDWSAHFWQWFFSLPADVNPFFDATGERCGYGQSGPVFFLAGAEQSVERSCVVPEGVHVFVPLLGSECSTVEPPPFFGTDEAELHQCAAELVDMVEGAFDMGAMGLAIDGETVTDLSAFRAATPRFTLWLPEDNLLGSAQRVADSVADGYQVLLRPLPAGEREVMISLPGPEPVTIA